MNQNKSVTLLFNPFFYIAGVKALGLGLGAIFLAGLVGWWSHTHFDGVLDMHTGASAPVWLFMAEGVIDWLSLFLVLWVCGKVISRSTFRAVDLLGTQALARWPAFIVSVIALPKAFQRFGSELLEQLKQGQFQFSTADAIIFFGVVIAMIPFLCWMVVLMYKSFSVSCNVKGGKAIGMFIAGILVAEVLSKLCLVLVFQQAGFGHSAAAAATLGAPVAVSLGAPAGEKSTDWSAAGAGFVGLLAGKDFAAAEAQFDPSMKSALPEEKLRAVWEDLLRQAGPYQKQLRTRVGEQSGYEVVLVSCQFEFKVFDVKGVYDFQKRLAGLFYLPGTAQ